MTPSSTFEELARLVRAKTAGALAEDEAFWARWAREYDRDESFLQLNYGFYHPSLRPVLDVELQVARELNRRGSHFKWADSETLLESARAELAAFAGVAAGEVVITRNASEALNIVIQGVTLAPGDEVVCSDQDYGAMDQAWEQRARGEGIHVRRVALPLDPADDDEIVRLFEAKITPRTRLLHVTHLVHFTGQILPVAKLCALGRRHGLLVLVDAAHSLAHVEFSIRELDCDYLGASLHKWLGAPLGTGVLFVRRDRIAGLRPLFGDTHFPGDDIRRLERFGNRPDSLVAGLREAIRWHQALGTAAKQARLTLLQRRWSEPMRDWPRFQLLTPRSPARHGAIGLFRLAGVKAENLFAYLLHEHRIFTMVMPIHGESALRIVPGLPTGVDDIARLVGALQAASGHFA